VIDRLDYQGSLTNVDSLSDRLAEAGLTATAAIEKARLFAQVATALSASESNDPRAFFVPGRIEILGKHTDYAGGHSMVATAERGFCLVARPRSDQQVTVTDVAGGRSVRFPLAPDLEVADGGWENYPMTVARRIARNFPGELRGAEIAFLSDLPMAAGMSSSSALMVAVFLALADASRLADRPEFRANIDGRLDLAGYLGTIENGQTFGTLEGDRGVGTFGGSEDHTALLCSRPGELGRFSYCPVRLVGRIPLPTGYTLAIATSGVAAEKTGAARERYNTASRLAGRLVELWRQATGDDDPHLAAVLADSPNAAARLRAIVEGTRGPDSAALLRRLEHFIVENQQVIPAAATALAKSNLAEFGRLVDRSQQAAEQLLGNQIPETICLAAMARTHGAVAASAFGAGFGGSVWALVGESRLDAFLAAWADAYHERFPQHATAVFFATGAAPPALQVC